MKTGRKTGPSEWTLVPGTEDMEPQTGILDRTTESMSSTGTSWITYFRGVSYPTILSSVSFPLNPRGVVAGKGRG